MSVYRTIGPLVYFCPGRKVINQTTQSQHASIVYLFRCSDAEPEIAPIDFPSIPTVENRIVL